MEDQAPTLQQAECVGHLARQCPDGPFGSQSTVIPNPIGNTPGTISVCSYCRRPGHVKQTCFKLRNGTSKVGLTGNILPYYCLSAESSFNKDGTLSIESAKVFCRSCTLLRDSGCNTAAIRENLIPADCLTGRVARVTTFCCQNRRFPTEIIDLDCDYFSGPIGVCVLKDSVADEIFGNIKGVRSLTVTPMVNVATRAQSKRAATEVPDGPQEVLSKSLVDSGLTPELVSVSTATPPQILSQPGNIIDFQCTQAAKTVTSNGSRLYPSEEDILSLYSNFAERQIADPTLSSCFGRDDKDPIRGISYVIDNGYLYRVFRHPGRFDSFKTLCVPESIRSQVLQSAHGANISGHTGWRKTLANIKEYFSWPGLSKDALDYVRSCHVCQIKSPSGTDRPPPYQPLPLIC
ncbi:gypsy retrotransposon integrase 1 [Plakobranchus ocellatus]|uniref:Gypsy retrotransposon integrase 1 n=1 Tax=Plakobranchus ocellatus TaxID=259542 RepID=A0AAV4DBE6_9GAST|nr:gypsy retrotransposon integrase 1 [Plakobranchus ocellatus]